MSSDHESSGSGDELEVASSAIDWIPIKGYHVVEQIIEQVRDRIFRNFAPGDRIGTESELAEAFGVSRLAVRDAIRSLRTLGLIEVRVGTGGGLWVAQSNAQHLADALAVQLHQLDVEWLDVTEALRCMEPALAALAAERRTEEDVKWLRLLVEHHRSTLDDQDASSRSASDFHIAIAAAARNSAMLVAVKALRLNLDRLSEPEQLSPIGEEMVHAHEQILHAIESRQPARAARLMDQHGEAVSERRRPQRGRSSRIRKPR